MDWITDEITKNPNLKRADDLDEWLFRLHPPGPGTKGSVKKIFEAIDQAVKEERERCAKIAENYSPNSHDMSDAGHKIAEKIRSEK